MRGSAGGMGVEVDVEVPGLGFRLGRAGDGWLARERRAGVERKEKVLVLVLKRRCWRFGDLGCRFGLGILVKCAAVSMDGFGSVVDTELGTL